MIRAALLTSLALALAVPAAAQDSRLQTLVYNADGKLIANLPADRVSRVWPEDADPARVTLQLDLLPTEAVEPYLYVEDRIACATSQGVRPV